MMSLPQALCAATELEERGSGNSTLPLSPSALDKPMQMGLFGAPAPALEALSAIDPDELTPKQALEALYRLRGML